MHADVAEVRPLSAVLQRCSHWEGDLTTRDGSKELLTGDRLPQRVARVMSGVCVGSIHFIIVDGGGNIVVVLISPSHLMI